MAEKLFWVSRNMWASGRGNSYVTFWGKKPIRRLGIYNAVMYGGDGGVHGYHLCATQLAEYFGIDIAPGECVQVHVTMEQVK